MPYGLRCAAFGCSRSLLIRRAHIAYERNADCGHTYRYTNRTEFVLNADDLWCILRPYRRCQGQTTLAWMRWICDGPFSRFIEHRFTYACQTPSPETLPPLSNTRNSSPQTLQSKGRSFASCIQLAHKNVHRWPAGDWVCYGFTVSVPVFVVTPSEFAPIVTTV